MAHFVELNENNKVIRGIVVHNNELLDENGIELEQKGIDFCTNLLGGKWIQTSYNSNFRKHYAGIGFYYDETLDAFIPPKPYDSWILDEETCLWQAPVLYPTDGQIYNWDEASQSWKVISFS